jgi:hypothetical protein
VVFCWRRLKVDLATFFPPVYRIDTWGEGAVAVAGGVSKASARKLQKKKLSKVVRAGCKVGVGRTMAFMQALSTRTLNSLIAHATGIALGLARRASWTMAECLRRVLTMLCDQWRSKTD